MGCSRENGRDFQILNCTGIGVEPRDYFVRQFLRLLLSVRGALVDVQDVGSAVIFESQLRFHSTSPSTSFPDKWAVMIQ